MTIHVVGDSRYCVIETSAGFYVSSKAGDLVYFASALDDCLLWIAGLPEGLR